MLQSMSVPDPAPLLATIGRRVKARRAELGISGKALAERAGLSPRFVASLEAGQANIAIGRLAAVAWALELPLPELVASARRSVALLGLRGAGKTTLGRALARAVGLPFIEVDERVEEAAGLSLGELFALHGEATYRRYEHEVLRGLLATDEPRVLALSGGIVGNQPAWALVRQRCLTAWLRATPEQHMSRVRAQGDVRPMRDREDAMAELRAILAAREPGYGQAELEVETSSGDAAACLGVLRTALAEAGWVA
jgi:XRE family aerobic/anaerobic benzoate catabolism transcriptional regulator